MRVQWIDMVRGLAIVMIVMWHSYLDVRLIGEVPGLLARAMEILRDIRLPAFFLCSGIVTARVLRQDWPDYLTRRIQGPLWLIVIWTLVNLGFEHSGHLLSLRRDQPVVAWHELFWVPYGNLWFLYALIGVALIARGLRDRPLWMQGIVLAALSLTLRQIGQLGLPETLDWLVNRLWQEALPFFMLGIWFGPVMTAVLRPGPQLWRNAGLIGAAALGGLLLSRLGLPLSGQLRTLAMTAGFVSVVALFARVSPLASGLTWIGQRSAGIYVAHQIFIALVIENRALLLPEMSIGAVWVLTWGVALGGTILLYETAQRLNVGWVYAPPEGAIPARRLQKS